MRSFIAAKGSPFMPNIKQKVQPNNSQSDIFDREITVAGTGRVPT
jgi:hypothetical protein